MTGRCLCGAITYRVDTEPTITANCHCRDCQRQTGTAFSVLVAVTRASLHIDGDIATYTTVGTDTHMEVRRQFCSNCGSPIVSLPDMTPDLAFIKAGTLDDTTMLVPEMDVWCDSAMGWVEMDDDARGQWGRGVPLEF